MNQTYIKLNVKQIETCGLRYAETQRNTSLYTAHRGSAAGLPGLRGKTWKQSCHRH
jgi:hypothetical protein